jgi:uncharacterized protein (DUF983 family)
VVCGEDRVFEGLWRMRHHCHACRYVYDREPGYFLGAIYVNYGVTCVLALTLFYSLKDAVDWPLSTHLAVFVPFAVVFPLLFFRYSRLLWMSIDVWCSVPSAKEDFLPPPGDPPAG